MVQCKKNTDDIPETTSNNSELAKYNLTEQDLKEHQFTIPGASSIKSNDEANSKIENETIAASIKSISDNSAGQLTTRANPAFDVNLFLPLVSSALKNKVIGYSLHVTQGNSVIGDFQYHWAKTPNDGNQIWSADTRMHIASTSKLMTAMGLVKLLDKKNISLDAPIAPYLPTYWIRGFNFNQRVTFRKLLQHTSGFSGTDSKCDYQFMKEQVAKNIFINANIPLPFEYANVNYSIMRVLITVIDGKLTAGTTFNLPANFILDAAWDVVSVNYFQDYMNKEVFSKAGLPTIGFDPSVGGPTAKAYQDYNSSSGRDGNWGSVSGAAGFYMSTNQVLKTINAFRNNLIVPSTLANTTPANPNRAQYMLNNALGVNGAFASPVGGIFLRKGQWDYNSGEEQTVEYMLPNNVNVTVFVNSRVKDFIADDGNGKHIHALISAAVLQSIH